jgi:hypothetical protein
MLRVNAPRAQPEAAKYYPRAGRSGQGSAGLANKGSVGAADGRGGDSSAHAGAAMTLSYSASGNTLTVVIRKFPFEASDKTNVA